MLVRTGLLRRERSCFDKLSTNGTTTAQPFVLSLSKDDWNNILSMRLLLRTARAQSDGWRDAIAAALPEATITVWPDVDAHPDYVVAWKPSAELFARIARPRAIFNLGAGVDAMLALPTLPRDVPLYRLEDAGMAEQMADYVTLAALAAYREQRDYAQAQRERRWAPRARIA